MTRMTEINTQKIFVTLGSQQFQFNRLLQAVDSLYEQERLTCPAFAQIGHSTYQPAHYLYKQFLSSAEFSEKMDWADIVITHGGTGTIVSAVKRRKKVIAVPRLAAYGEHVDDHQIQLIEQFKELNRICVCCDLNCLWTALEDVMSHRYSSYCSNTARYIESIEQYISSIADK